MTHIPQKHEIETFTGQYVDVSNPDPSTIKLEDIAHGLSNVCRYSGQSRRFYSVAEHAVQVSERVKVLGYDRLTQLEALHHDSPEAYLTDIPRPLKSLLLPQYEELTRRMETAIAVALDVPAEDPLTHQVIKDADNAVLMLEARTLLPSKGEGWAGNGCNTDCAAPEDGEDWFPACLSPEVAENMFLARHYELIALPYRGRTIHMRPGQHGFVGELDTVVRVDAPYDREQDPLALDPYSPIKEVN